MCGEPDWPAVRGGKTGPGKQGQLDFGEETPEPAQPKSQPRIVFTVIRFSGHAWYARAVDEAAATVGKEFPNVDIHVVEARTNMDPQVIDRTRHLVVVDCDSRKPDPGSATMGVLKGFCAAEFRILFFASNHVGVEVLNYLDRSTGVGLPEHIRKTKANVLEHTAGSLRAALKRLG